MNKRRLWQGSLVLSALAVVLFAIWGVLQPSGPTPLTPVPGHQPGPQGQDEQVESGQLPTGPHGGGMFSDGDLTVELAQQVENGHTVFVAYPYSDQKPQPPDSVGLTLNVMGDSASYKAEFHSRKSALVAELPLVSVHIRELAMEAEHGNHRHHWQYEYE